MSKEMYNFDLQNKMEGGMWDVEDGIKVKCWKSLPSRTRETDRWSRVDGNLTEPAFKLIIGSRCNGGSDQDKLDKCKENNQDLPFVSYMNDGVMHVTSSDDIYGADLSKEPRGSAGDMIQVAHLDFDYPTLDYTAQLPLPEIITVGNIAREGSKTFDVRHVPEVYSAKLTAIVRD